MTDSIVEKERRAASSRRAPLALHATGPVAAHAPGVRAVAS
ncbi:hypothetical protein [Streptomyces sp. NBC_01497]|nr:hypothetical protein [Streptomyces sp. NBC_01497]